MQDRIGDELEDVEKCPHDDDECRCKCHYEPVIHDRPCCTPCYRCGHRVPTKSGDWRMKFL